MPLSHAAEVALKPLFVLAATWNVYIKVKLAIINSVTTNKVFTQIGYFSKQINPVLTNPRLLRAKMTGPELFIIIELDCIHIIELE